MPEIKGSDPEAADALVADILARGLRRDVIVQSFNFTFASKAAAVGIEALHLTNAPNYPALVSAGIRHIGVSQAAITSTIVQQAHLNGLRVWVYNANSVAARDSLFAMGVDGVFTNKPTTVRIPN